MGKKNFNLRKAAPADIPAINGLFIQMLQSIYQKTEVDGYKEGDLGRFFCGTGDWICVAEAEGRVAAFLSMEEHHDEADYLYLDDFSVTAPCRSGGIGTALLEAAQGYARDKGLPLLVLHVEKTNARARSFYTRRGFVEDKDEGSRIRMKKILTE